MSLSGLLDFENVQENSKRLKHIRKKDSFVKYLRKFDGYECFMKIIFKYILSSKFTKMKLNFLSVIPLQLHVVVVFIFEFNFPILS